VGARAKNKVAQSEKAMRHSHAREARSCWEAWVKRGRHSRARWHEGTVPILWKIYMVHASWHRRAQWHRLTMPKAFFVEFLDCILVRNCV